MEFDLALLVAGILIALVLFLLLKNVVKLIINSILGLLLIFFINYFHVMAHLGRPDIQMDLVTVLFCALGGIPGALTYHCQRANDGNKKAHETPQPELMGLFSQPLGESNPSLQNENLSS